ncbi:uridine diphosphate-N-acetylglucosamine-binding protein YvcK [Martelella alba]|uniref:Putative gluconeogenesis factor n=1 Tax=Martelella alba TaxID=2590451 RepID=A0ABY2SP83_9HYPH|nr:uridine diphosphate-N-acetylglucosamine-binding protein YvcK [Martelella alba]TKI07409.1 uridine diphosphate-N-acetylglucosamine-binding protein YvcK [Martelella alba]
MRNPTLAQLQRVVALGGGHGLGRAMSALSFLGPRLTGIVATTDNGGSTGRIRHAQGGIAWGDTRNCLNQLVSRPSLASAMFEYRFGGQGELAGHNLGNLMLKALDNLSVRPLDAINLLRDLLKVDARLIPMSEQPADLRAVTADGQTIHGEVAVDGLPELPVNLRVYPAVAATQEAIRAVAAAELLLIGPGSFLTSLMPPLLLPDLSGAVRLCPAPLVYIDNLGPETSVAATALTLRQKQAMIEHAIGGNRRIDAIITGVERCPADTGPCRVICRPLAVAGQPHRHDRTLLRAALDSLLLEWPELIRTQR